jgi:hypothetical protein
MQGYDDYGADSEQDGKKEQKGGLDQFQLLVVPPSMGRGGMEHMKSAKLVVQGKAQSFQRPPPPTAGGGAVRVRCGGGAGGRIEPATYQAVLGT